MHMDHHRWMSVSIIAVCSHHEFLHTDWESSRVEQDLTALWQEADNIFNQDHKVLGQQLVSLNTGIIRHTGVKIGRLMGNFNVRVRGEQNVRATLTSSITMICVLSTLATPFLIRSSILPGVAITTCTGKKKNKEDVSKFTDIVVQYYGTTCWMSHLQGVFSQNRITK